MQTLFNRADQISFRRILRKTMPAPELILWQKLRDRQLLGLRFRRQHGIGHYILDFYCNSLNLAIELDGESHATRSGHLADTLRDAYLNSLGIKILRFQNTDVRNNLEGVLAKIAESSGFPSLSEEGTKGRSALNPTQCQTNPLPTTPKIRKGKQTRPEPCL